MSAASESVGKRMFDAVASLLLLVASAPLQGIVALLLLRRLGRPILFRQARVGLNGRPFVLVKFRTMTDATDAEGQSLSHEERMSRLGSTLRATSLDELPTLMNVLRGEMSLVGPRPLPVKYLPRYTVRQARRHEVRPGVTGWAQVRGRNAISWEEKFDLDVWYVDHWSFGLDMRILLMTVLKVVRREGIAAAGHAIMPEFKGSEWSNPPEPPNGDGGA